MRSAAQGGLKRRGISGLAPVFGTPKLQVGCGVLLGGVNQRRLSNASVIYEGRRCGRLCHFHYRRPSFGIDASVLERLARLLIPIQNVENQELWRDLDTGDTPPKAAVGNEGQAQAPREWEKTTNLIDCEKAGGMWDVPNNRCSEKR